MRMCLSVVCICTLPFLLILYFYVAFFAFFSFKNLGVRLIQEKLKSVVLVIDQRKVKYLFFVILVEMLTLCSCYSYCIEAAFRFRCGPLPIFFKLSWVNMKVSP